MLWLLDCNPADSGYVNEDCLRTYDKEKKRILGCALGAFQDKFYNRLTYAPDEATCQAGEYGACRCGPGTAPPTKSCPCCTFPDALLAVTPQAGALCADIVSGFKWAS